MRRFVLWTTLPLTILTVLSVQPAGATDTWTRITGPKGPGQGVFQFVNDDTTPDPTITVSGTASSNVATVNVYCLYDNDRKTTSNTPLNAAPIPVTGGAFTASGVSAPSVFDPPYGVPCILRAVPGTYSGIDGAGNNTGYVASYAGPEFYPGGYRMSEAGGTPVSWYLNSVHPLATNQLASPDNYTVGSNYTVDHVANRLGQTATDGNFGILTGNLTDSGDPSTRSALVVDGHSTYFPADVASYAVSADQVPAITFHAKRLSNGELLISERAPLRYCQGDAYPPTSGTCTPVDPGVVFVQTITTAQNGAVATLRQRFVDTSGKSHSLKVEYYQYVNAYTTASVKWPGASSFTTPTASALFDTPTRPSTIYLSSDSRAVKGDPNVANTGFTYSGHPKIFVQDAYTFGMRYSRTVPKNGFAGLAFGVETAVSLSTVETWAAERQRALREKLRITVPGKHAEGPKVIVKGRVRNPVNGYPATVAVTVGGTTRRVAVSQSGRWKATFPLDDGRFTARAKAVDPSGIVLRDRHTFRVG